MRILGYYICSPTWRVIKYVARKWAIIYIIRNLECQTVYGRYSLMLNIFHTLLGQIAWQFACVVFCQKSPENWEQCSSDSPLFFHGIKQYQCKTTNSYVPVKSKLQHPPPPGNPPGIWIFGKFLFKFPPHRAKKLFKCPHPRENYQITVLTFQ